MNNGSSYDYDDDESFRMETTDSPDTAGKSDMNESPALVICTSPDVDYGDSPSMDEDKLEDEYVENENENRRNCSQNKLINRIGQTEDIDIENDKMMFLEEKHSVNKRLQDIEAFRGSILYRLFYEISV